MTDNLRTRIAAALQPRLLSIMRFPDTSIAQSNANTMADAVIRELGLSRERIWTDRPELPEWQHRYVTEWTTDE